MDWTDEQAAAALEQLRYRASCRQFSDKDIPAPLLDALLNTALCAASGGNLQPWSIVVIKDKERALRMSKICDDQSFIAQAPVNLLFLLDWHKMRIYAQHEKAPFTCPDSYMHYLIGLEDVMCAAQTIETAAFLAGLGSCYVGSTNHHARDIIDLCKLPPLTFPVLLLSLGYKAAPLTVRKKLDRGVMVFHEHYGQPEPGTEASEPLQDADIIAFFQKKYGSASMKIPEKEPYRSEMLDDLKRALLTSYSAEETEAILQKAVEAGRINETQRRFGLHYHAEDMRKLGEEIIAEMAAQGLTPFHMTANV